MFELALWTASSRAVAEVKINSFDPYREIFRQRFYRDSCTPSFLFFKDLTMLRSDLAKVVLVDDMPCVGAYTPSNVIPIAPFRGDQSDNALIGLLETLKTLNEAMCSSTPPDVRPVLSRMFALERRALAFEGQGCAGITEEELAGHVVYNSRRPKGCSCVSHAEHYVLAKNQGKLKKLSALKKRQRSAA